MRREATWRVAWCVVRMCGRTVLTDAHVGTAEADGDDLSALREQYDEWDHEG